jgi:hypothetical protein
MSVHREHWPLQKRGQFQWLLVQMTNPATPINTSALANNGHDTRALQTYLGHRNIQHTAAFATLEGYDKKEPQRPVAAERADGLAF